MDSSVERILPQVRIVPARRDQKRGGKRPFTLKPALETTSDDDEPRSKPAVAPSKPVGHATHDEVGIRIDLTA